MTLSPRQQRFVEEYLVDLNGTQAAIRAGYAPGAAKVQACRLLTKDNIAQAITEGREKLSQQTEINQRTVLEGFHREANYFGEGASHSARVSAFGGLAKVLGLDTQKHELSGPGGKPIENHWTVEFVNASSPRQPET